MQKLPMSDAFMRGIWTELGKLAVAFGRLEYMIMLIGKGAIRRKHQNAGAGAVTFTRALAEASNNKVFFELCDRVTQLCDEAYKPPSAELIAIKSGIGEAKELARDRNDYIHAHWTARPDGSALRVRPTWNKDRQTISWVNSRPVQITEIRALRRKAERLTLQLHQLALLWHFDSGWLVKSGA